MRGSASFCFCFLKPGHKLVLSRKSPTLLDMPAVLVSLLVLRSMTTATLIKERV